MHKKLRRMAGGGCEPGLLAASPQDTGERMRRDKDICSCTTHERVGGLVLFFEQCKFVTYQNKF
jgi:hypothetical protein